MLWNVYPCNNILPAEFTQEISNYELVCKLMHLIKQLAEDLKNAYDELENLIQAGDEANKQLILQIQSQLQTEINNAITDYNNKINALDLKTQQNLANAVSNINGQINFLRAQFNMQLSQLEVEMRKGDSATRAYVENELEAFKKWLEDNACKYGYVKSPFTNEIKSVQYVINQIADELREHAMTCQDWDLNNLTCQQIDNRFVTAHQYDYHSKFYFWFQYKTLYPNAETGIWQNYNQTISYLISLHQHGFTAQAFQDENYSADYLDGIGYTALDWDTKIFMGGDTAKEYDELELTAQRLDDFQYTAYYWDYNKV